jgi:hypothetical protein
VSFGHVLDISELQFWVSFRFICVITQSQAGSRKERTMARVKECWGVFAFALALSASAQSTNGLVAYYPFSGNASDASGNGNDGVPSQVMLVLDRFGVSSAAYEFDGSNSVITIPSLSSTNLSELTLSVWVEPAAAPSAQGDIINKWRGFSYSLEDYALTLGSDLRVVFGNGRHGNGYSALANHCTITSTNPLSVGRWSQIVATLDSSGTGRIWVNSVLAAQDNILQLLPPATEPVRIGELLLATNSPYNGAILDSFNGLIDDVRIYNRALSGSEVQQLYFAEAGPIVSLIKAVKPSFTNLTLSTSYQLQVSADLNTWTNSGSPFTATNTSMVYPQYWDVDNWGRLFFRLQVGP